MLMFRFLIVLFFGAGVMGVIDVIERVTPRVVLWWIARAERKDALKNR